MPSLSTSILSLLFGVAVRAQTTFPAPGPCAGVCSYIKDPTIVIRESDNTYFRFATFENIQVHTAPTIDGPWTAQEAALPNGSLIVFDGTNANNTWAPDAHYLEGTYYVYYAVSVVDTQISAIGVATSTTMDDGSWVDHGALAIPNSTEYNLIDPNLFTQTGTDGCLLTFGSYWDGIFQVAMTDPLTVLSDPEPVNIAYNPDDGNPLEGSYQFWYPVNSVDYFYLFVSRGLCCNEPPDLPPAGDEYQINVCRGTSATGPFIDQDGVDCLDGGGTLVLGSHDDVYAPGGQGVYYDTNLDAIILYYAYLNPTIGYTTEDFLFGWNYLEFDDDAWPVVVSVPS